VQPTLTAHKAMAPRSSRPTVAKWSLAPLISRNQVRALAEVYASSDAQQVFVRDFVAAWDKDES
jgi:catalase (peroxidase I)